MHVVLATRVAKQAAGVKPTLDLAELVTMAWTPLHDVDTCRRSDCSGSGGSVLSDLEACVDASGVMCRMLPQSWHVAGCPSRGIVSMLLAHGGSTMSEINIPSPLLQVLPAALGYF